MQSWTLKTNLGAMQFTAIATAIAAILSVAFTSFVYSVLQPSTYTACLFSSLLTALTVAPILAGLLASKVLHIQKMRDQLAEQANLDPLTSLLNRRGFRNKVLTEQRRMERSGARACLLLIDLDHFKHVNDVHGHTAGDMVLQALAEALRTNVRPSMDQVSRWGGEEFVLLISGTDIDGATRAAERLRGIIETLDPSIGKICLGITASVGVAQLYVGQTLEDALDHADRCLYEAKETGRNKVVSTNSKKLRIVA